jgi:hypothetical protein
MRDKEHSPDGRAGSRVCLGAIAAHDLAAPASPGAFTPPPWRACAASVGNGPSKPKRKPAAARMLNQASCGRTCSPNSRTCSTRSGIPATSTFAHALSVNRSVKESSAWFSPAGA